MLTVSLHKLAPDSDSLAHTFPPDADKTVILLSDTVSGVLHMCDLFMHISFSDLTCNP